jgi:ketosteroid isomerase-like protein
MNDNVETVQKIYDAFSRADVDAILAVLIEDVDWASEASSRLAPWYGARRGKAEVAQFFADLAGAIDVTEFTVLAIGANETDVMAVIRFGITAKETGHSGGMDLHHWWRFRDGKVNLYRGTEDTALTGALLGTRAFALQQ